MDDLRAVRTELAEAARSAAAARDKAQQLEEQLQILRLRATELRHAAVALGAVATQVPQGVRPSAWLAEPVRAAMRTLMDLIRVLPAGEEDAGGCGALLIPDIPPAPAPAPCDEPGSPVTASRPAILPPAAVDSPGPGARTWALSSADHPNGHVEGWAQLPSHDDSHAGTAHKISPCNGWDRGSPGDRRGNGILTVDSVEGSEASPRVPQQGAVVPHPRQGQPDPPQQPRNPLRFSIAPIPKEKIRILGPDAGSEAGDHWHPEETEGPGWLYEGGGGAEGEVALRLWQPLEVWRKGDVWTPCVVAQLDALRGVVCVSGTDSAGPYTKWMRLVDAPRMLRLPPAPAAAPTIGGPRQEKGARRKMFGGRLAKTAGDDTQRRGTETDTLASPRGEGAGGFPREESTPTLKDLPRVPSVDDAGTVFGGGTMKGHLSLGQGGHRRSMRKSFKSIKSARNLLAAGKGKETKRRRSSQGLAALGFFGSPLTDHGGGLARGLVSVDSLSQEQRKRFKQLENHCRAGLCGPAYKLLHTEGGDEWDAVDPPPTNAATKEDHKTLLHMVACGDAFAGARERKALRALAHGAAVNAHDKNGDTPLSLAVRHARALMVRALIDVGADPAVTLGGEDAGAVPLHLACRHDRWGRDVQAEQSRAKEAIRLLMTEQTVRARDRKGQTALHIACANGHAALARMLLRGTKTVGPSDHDIRDLDEKTPADYMMQRKERVQDWLSMLLEIETDPKTLQGAFGRQEVAKAMRARAQQQQKKEKELKRESMGGEEALAADFPDGADERRGSSASAYAFPIDDPESPFAARERSSKQSSGWFRSGSVTAPPGRPRAGSVARSLGHERRCSWEEAIDGGSGSPAQSGSFASPVIKEPDEVTASPPQATTSPTQLAPTAAVSSPTQPVLRVGSSMGIQRRQSRMVGMPQDMPASVGFPGST